jgi:thymidylate kinase
MKEKLPEDSGISTIAFEGINRVGKGTQIELFKKVLSEIGVNFVELRGDGTREGAGTHEGDPLDAWWQENSKKLRNEGTAEDWHDAAYKLALEMKEWRTKAKDLNKEVALIDRSILSRASFVIDRDKPANDILLITDLYPEQKGEKLILEEILPDVIFELTAPKDVVLSRLDPADPKTAFRIEVIEKSYEIFYKAKNRLPKEIQDRIVSVDATLTPDIVFDNILETLNTRVESWKKLKKIKVK